MYHFLYGCANMLYGCANMLLELNTQYHFFYKPYANMIAHELARMSYFFSDRVFHIR